MTVHPVRSRILFAFGLLGLVIGTLDPLEGAPLIVVSIAALALAVWLRRSPEWMLFFWALPLTAIGVALLFWLSSPGGRETRRATWGLLLLLPYAVGWLLAVTGCTRELIRQFRRSRVKGA